MPIYEFTCPCGVRQETFMFVKDYSLPECPECGRLMNRHYTPPAGIHVFEEYHHHGIGERVTSKSDLKNKMLKKAEEVSARTGLDTKYEIP